MAASLLPLDAKYCLACSNVTFSSTIVLFCITANFLFNEKFWLGGSYRINENTGALGALVDFQVSKNFRLGYAYEHPFSDVSQHSNGTHEVLLMFELNNTPKSYRTKSPRYF